MITILKFNCSKCKRETSYIIVHSFVHDEVTVSRIQCVKCNNLIACTHPNNDIPKERYETKAH